MLNPGEDPGCPNIQKALNRVLRRFLTLLDMQNCWYLDNLNMECSFRHSDSSLYLDSLNEQTPSACMQFLLSSPMRQFSGDMQVTWGSRYFDSIDSTVMAPEQMSSTDQFLLRRGEAMAECDSLECHTISSDNCS